MSRSVRPRAGRDVRESSQDDAGSLGASSPSLLDTEEQGEILSTESDDEGSEAGEDEDGNNNEDAQQQLKSIPFGTLVRANESMSRKRKRGMEDDAGPGAEDKLDALRARLRELREAKGQSLKDKDASRDRKQSSNYDHRRQEKDDSDSASRDSSSDSDQPKARSSKHAPSSQSSTRQVTRKRGVIEQPKLKIRDPRFGVMAGAVDEAVTNRNYSFLNNYRDEEMSELKAAIKKAKSNPDDQMKLKRKLMSMENRKRSEVEKERRQAVIREHRKKEREAVAQGKKPYYQKEADIRRQALTDKFEGMKGKEREKAIERRRRKESQKEKKSMPMPRRIAG